MLEKFIAAFSPPFDIAFVLKNRLNLKGSGNNAIKILYPVSVSWY